MRLVVTAVPRILPCGDAALAVEFGSAIDPALNARVLSLDARLAGAVAGIVETVPTYRSLLVHYDPLTTSYGALAVAIDVLARDLPDTLTEGRVWRVPVVYGGPFGIDLEDVAARHGLTTAQIVERHAAPTYQVYMLGFVPGYAYLGGLDATLATPRREVPRAVMPAGSISIGGIQAAIASIEAPSGWHLLGRTPVRNFMPDREPNFLIGAGDRVRFEPIDASRFEALDRAAAAGEPVAEVIG
jgi:KipI family sensor histidine kinase inhibitor